MASTPFRCEYSTNWRKKASRRRAHEPSEVVTADRADRIGGVQCGMVDQLPAHGVCRCAAGSGRAGPVDREMKGERMWTKTKKKARLMRAQRAALMNGAQGKTFTVTYQDDPTYNKWHPSTVLRILNSSAYIGELVSGKTQTASYKGIGLHPVEKKEWHIVENAHEAIILKSDFEKVQARREQNKERRERAMARSKATREKCYNHLSGMVYCGCCRRNMTFERRVHGTVKETHYGVFVCKRKKNTTPCAYHAVPEKMLMMVAMDQIHHLVSTMCEEEKMVKDMMRGSNLDSARSIKMKENSILFRIQEAEERRLRLYEDYKAEILDEDEYSQLKEHYIAEKQRLEHELQKQRQRALELEKRIKICDAQMERMRGILNQNEFDEELVHELIKRIYVGMDNSVEVEFKCSDPYQEVLAIMSEVQNE